MTGEYFSGCSLLLAVLTGRKAALLQKYPVEGTGILKTAGIADLGYGPVGGVQQFLCPADPKGVDIGRKMHSQTVCKQPGQLITP